MALGNDITGPNTCHIGLKTAKFFLLPHSFQPLQVDTSLTMPLKTSATSSALANNLNVVVQEFLDQYRKVATTKNLVSEILDPPEPWQSSGPYGII